MKKFKQFIEDTAGVPTNVTGSNVSTDVPIVGRKASNKYKKLNKKDATDVILYRRKSPTGTTSG